MVINKLRQFSHFLRNGESSIRRRTALVFCCSVLLGLTIASDTALMANTDYNRTESNKFSFNEPSTFSYASDQQKETLRSIAEEEFSLDHLTQEDQDLLDEALRYSGVEVHPACVIDQHTCARFRAFLGRWAPDRDVRFHPAHGFKDLLKSQDSELLVSEWTMIVSDIAEYPYPFSEAQVLPKAIPLDLSSIRLRNRTNTTASFTGYPSRLLIESVAEDNIVARKDLAVDFVIGLNSKRVTTQSLYLPKPVRVHRGVSLRELSITYKFENDEISNRNVLVSMNQTMKGRIWVLFRPKLIVESKLSYVECVEEAVSQSYLYESIDAIRALGVGSDG